MMAPMSLPPGFRFHPTDEELVAYYLDRKVKGRSIELQIIPQVDLYKCEPWELPEKSYLPGNDMEWYFYSTRDKKYPNGSRTNRATREGYWKATGKDRQVESKKVKMGMKKTLVYYRGRAPHGLRTSWVMHEYRLIHPPPSPSFKESYALCRVFKKSIQIPKRGEEEEISTVGKEKEEEEHEEEEEKKKKRKWRSRCDESEMHEREEEERWKLRGSAETSSISSELTQGNNNTTLQHQPTLSSLNEANSSYSSSSSSSSIFSLYLSSSLIQDHHFIPDPLQLLHFPHLSLNNEAHIMSSANQQHLPRTDSLPGTLHDIFSFSSSTHPL